MAASVAATAARKGLSAADVVGIVTAVRLAMGPREKAIADDHDPAFLHPGRVALILLHDTEAPDPLSLQTAILLESRDPVLRLDPSTIRSVVGRHAADALASVPRPGQSDLAERLVTLDAGLRTAALAERLDHLRHEHLREPVTPWPELWRETATVWLPVAERTSQPLARRYRHWVRTFERRL
jgi:hypothetical protein